MHELDVLDAEASLSIVGGFQSLPIVRNTLNWWVDAITIGPDDDLWFLCRNQPNGWGWIGKIDSWGDVQVVLDFSVTPELPNVSPQNINSADADTLWLLYNSWPPLTTVGCAAQLTLAGDIQQWTDPGVGSTGPTTVTSDGNLWFTNFQWAGLPTDNIHSIGRVDSAGNFEWYLGPQITINDVTTGPDGAFWFTLRDQVGHITLDGHVEYFPIPPANLPPYYYATSIATGPDQNLWITFAVGASPTQSSTQIARMTPQGAFTFHPVPPAMTPALNPWPNHRIVTSAGSLWFVMDEDHGALCNITTAGQPTVEDAGPSFLMFTEAVAAGSDIFLRPWHGPGLAKWVQRRPFGGRREQEIAKWMQIMWTVALLHHGGPPPPPLDTESVMGREQLIRAHEAAQHILELTSEALGELAE